MNIVHRVENGAGGISDFPSKAAAFAFCKLHQDYRYVGLVYCFH